MFLIRITILAMMSLGGVLSGVLQQLSGPVLIPLLISGLTWVVNEYTTLLQRLNKWAVRALIMIVPPLLAAAANWVSARLGMPLDLSSVNAAAGSLVAILIFHIGKAD